MGIGIDELLRNRKPRLILPHLKVGVRRLGGDGDSSSDLVSLRSLEFVSSRSFAAAQPSGKIDFPTRRSSNCVLTLITAVPGKTIRYRTQWTHDALAKSRARRLQISRRQKLRARCRGRRSRLADTRKGSRKIEILVQGALHDSHEHRIAEACPPTVERWCRKFRLRRTGSGEIMKWSEIGGGLHIAWPHGTTTCKFAEGKNDRRRFEHGLTQLAFLTVTAEIADESVKGGREEKTEAGHAQHPEQHGRTQRPAHFGSCSRGDRQRGNPQDERVGC